MIPTQDMVTHLNLEQHRHPATLGVDAAQSGAAVLLAPGVLHEVMAVWTWRVLRRKSGNVWRVCPYVQGEVLDPFTIAPMGAIGGRILGQLRELVSPGYLLGAEEAVVGRARDTSIIVARNAGRVVGPLETLACGREAEWVRATTWRRLLLDLHPQTRKEDAKLASVRGMPIRIKGLQEAMDAMGDSHDIPDAAGVAEWRRLLEVDEESARADQRKSARSAGKKLRKKPSKSGRKK